MNLDSCGGCHAKDYVAARHPKVPFIVPHFGAGYFREALMLADLCPNVYLDTSSSNRWMRYHAPHLDLRAVFRQALEVAGPKRLLFGSGGGDLFERTLGIVERASAPAGAKEAILSRNAERLFA